MKKAFVFIAVLFTAFSAAQAQQKNRVTYNVANLQSKYAPFNISYERSLHKNIGLEVSLAHFSVKPSNPKEGVIGNVVLDDYYYTGDLLSSFFLNLLFTPSPRPAIGTIQSACNQRGTMFTVGPKFYAGKTIRPFIQPEFQYYSYSKDIYTLNNAVEYGETYNTIVRTARLEKNIAETAHTFRLNTGLQVNFKTNVVFELAASLGVDRENKKARASKKSYQTPGEITRNPELPFRHSVIVPMSLKLGYAF